MNDWSPRTSTTLLNRLEPVAKSLRCADELSSVAEIYQLGASYQRQRRRWPKKE